MTPEEVRQLRDALALSRAALARFLGVAEMTIVRWEAGTESSPRGLQLVVLKALQKAVTLVGPAEVNRLILGGVENQGQALHRLLSITHDDTAQGGARDGQRRPK